MVDNVGLMILDGSKLRLYRISGRGTPYARDFEVGSSYGGSNGARDGG